MVESPGLPGQGARCVVGIPVADSVRRIVFAGARYSGLQLLERGESRKKGPVRRNIAAGKPRSSARLFKAAPGWGGP